MTTTLIVAALGILALVAYGGHVAESTDSTPTDMSARAPAAVIDLPDEVAVGDRYLVPHLPARVVDHLPAAEVESDQYLPERIELAELVIGERIPVAERQAAISAHDLPGFTEVLMSDGFRQDPDGAWYYDRFSSWMRFPLNR